MVKRLAFLPALPALLVPTLVSGQTVGGVILGETTVHEVRRIQGKPDSRGLTETGFAFYLSYGDRTFYFAGGDSVAVAARIFPDAMSRDEVEQVFGSPDREKRKPDLSIYAVYADTVAVQYARDGQSVEFLEYSLPDEGWKSFLERERQHQAAEDLEAFERRLRESANRIIMRAVARKVVELCDQHTPIPGAVWDSAFADVSEEKRKWVRHFEDVLLNTAAGCDSVRAVVDR